MQARVYTGLGRFKPCGILRLTFDAMAIYIAIYISHHFPRDRVAC